MGQRQVKRTGKGAGNDITRLCGDAFSVTKAEAISHIESGAHRYWTQVPGTGAVEVHVVVGPNGKYLRTARDKTTRNNLEDLPDC